ncbi:mechanosensitive ion channel family protein, partial [bacterium]|nr:mechanosensitive ion channel family protein [bacterium]
MVHPLPSQESISLTFLGFILGFIVLKIGALFVLYWLYQRAFTRLVNRYQDSKDVIALTFNKSNLLIDTFVKTCFLITFLHFIIGDFSNYIPFKTKDIVQISTMAIMAWFAYIFVLTTEERLLREQATKFDATAVQTFTKLARLAIVIIVLFAVLPILGVETSGLLTLGAASSLVIGLASKDWLANFFGGLMIYIDKPFGVGDWIKCSEKGIEGTVMSIGWRLTCIRTFERRPLYVPNSFFAQTSIENPSRMENRRIKHFINLPYKDFEKIPLLLEAIREMLKQSKDVDQSKPIYVHITQLAHTSVECMVYCFTKYTDWENFLNA